MAYLSLSTANLPDPAIDPAAGKEPADYFNTVLYTGDGTTSHSITGVGFQPDFVWNKQRNGGYDNAVWDVLRDVTKRLVTNSTGAEATVSNGLLSFDSDGFTMGDQGGVNGSGSTYVAWNWKANGSGVSNTDGSITSTVSANTTSGFSVCTFTAPTSGTCTIGHGLDVAPEFFFIKSRANAYGWTVYHKDIGANKYLVLNTTASAATDTNTWNNTAPTSSVFTLGQNFQNTSTWVGYCFHSVDGFSKCGSYVGNGSTDGPFVYTGFRPAFVMVKATNVAQSWVMLDNERAGYNVENYRLFAESSNAESTTTPIVDLLSNGFKWRNNFGNFNGSGNTYIYMAFAENPFKYSNAR